MVTLKVGCTDERVTRYRHGIIEGRLVETVGDGEGLAFWLRLS